MIKNRGVDGLVRAGIIKSTLIVGQTSRLIIKLDNTYPLPDDVLKRNPLIRVTNGTYFIKYEPPCSEIRENDCHFIVGNDLLGFVLKVKNSKHFKSLANIFPEVAWMFKNTNYNPFYFKAAKMHPGMCFYFCVDWGTYTHNLMKQMERDGVDMIVARPLVTFRAAEKDWNYVMDDKSFAPNRKYYAKEIAESKRIAAEQNEPELAGPEII